MLYLSLVLMLAVSVQCSFAANNTHYVSPSGAATWASSTSIDTPCALSTALASYAAGDVIAVRGGTYSSSATFSRSGTATGRVTIAAQPGETPVFSQGFTVSGSYLDLSGFEVTPGRAGVGAANGQISISGKHNTLDSMYVHDTVSGSGFGFQSGAEYNTLSNFTAVNPSNSGVFFLQGDTVTAYNTVIHGEISGYGSGGSHEGLGLAGTGNTVDDVSIHDHNVKAGYDGDGIRPHGVNLTIRNCRLYNLLRTSTSAHTDAIQFWDHNTNLVIENNVIGSWKIGGMVDSTFPNDGGSQDCGTVIMMEAYHNSSVVVRNNLFLGSSYFAPINLNNGKPYADSALNVQLYNNTFYTRGPVVLNTTVGGLPVTVRARNNIFAGGATYGSTGYYSGISANNATFDSDYNIFAVSNRKPANEGSHSKVVGPLFVNPDISAAGGYGRTGDFRPQSTSPAIGAADTVYAPTTDITGAARDAAPDIGAYERLGSTPPPPADTTAPTVSITSPTAGSTVSGSVAIAATAADAVGVTSVEFSVDGTLVGTDSSAPYAATWNASGATAGSHTIQARAIDAAGNLTDSSVAVNIAVVPATTALTVSPPISATVTYGAKAKITGSLRDPVRGPLPGQTVAAEMLVGTVWRRVSTTVTGPNGAFTVVSPALVRTSALRVTYSGSTKHAPSKSAWRLVKPRVYLTKPSAPARMRKGKTYKASGHLRPRHTEGTRPVKIYAYRYQSGKWVLRRAYFAKAYDYSGYTKYRLFLTLPYRGKWRLRAGHAADSKNAQTFSGWRYVTVR